MTFVYSVLLPYILGSISFSWLAVRLKARLDLRKLGTGNLGAKNTLRVIGPLPAVLVGLLDAGKGWFALYLVSWLVPGSPGALLVAGLMVLVGHNFPLWLGFHGGKGLAALVGILLYLNPWLLLTALLVALAALLVLKKGNPAAIIAVCLLPLLMFLWLGGFYSLLMGLAMATVILVRHRRDFPDLVLAFKNRI